ncbi:hypothetical protein McanCB49686_006461 [Microsporum canis]
MVAKDADKRAYDAIFDTHVQEADAYRLSQTRASEVAPYTSRRRYTGESTVQRADISVLHMDPEVTDYGRSRIDSPPTPNDMLEHNSPTLLRDGLEDEEESRDPMDPAIYMA